MPAVLAVLVAPYRDRTEADRALLCRAKAALLATGCLPVFLPDTLADILSDSKPGERETALEASRQWCTIGARTPLAILVVVGSKMTEGMKSDIRAWQAATTDQGRVLMFRDDGTARESTVADAVATFDRSAAARTE